MVGAKSTVTMTRLASGLAFMLACACAAIGCERKEVPAREAADASVASGARVRLSPAPATGDVEPIVREEIARAATERRRLVVYVSAEWCEPCQRFHNAARDGQLDATFPDLTLLEFDLDRDGKRLSSAGYSSTYIPLFALPAPDGRASGRQVEGGIKGDGAVAYMTPRLQGLLAR
jgi:hypothetical protein